MFELLILNSEDTMNYFYEYIEFEDFQNNKNFRNEFRHLMTK
jgi:hypothetical protein